MGFIPQAQLEQMGFKSLGKNVLISDKASLYGVQHISIGDHSRIDDFCILSAGAGGLHLGRHVHIACYVSLIGHATITIEDFAGLSGKVSLYSSSDDFSGRFLTGPTVHPDFTNVKHEPVRLGRHVVVGTGSVILPGVTLHEGSALGAMSLARKDIEAFSIYSGAPAKFITKRKDDLLALEAQFLAAQQQQ